jgi:hypothetical protein
LWCGFRFADSLRPAALVRGFGDTLLNPHSSACRSGHPPAAHRWTGGPGGGAGRPAEEYRRSGGGSGGGYIRHADGLVGVWADPNANRQFYTGAVGDPENPQRAEMGRLGAAAAPPSASRPSGRRSKNGNSTGMSRRARTTARRGPLAHCQAAKPLKTFKTTMGSSCLELAWIWVWCHACLGLAPRPLGVGATPTWDRRRCAGVGSLAATGKGSMPTVSAARAKRRRSAAPAGAGKQYRNRFDDAAASGARKFTRLTTAANVS